MRAVLVWIVGLTLVANGAAMLALPETWYGLIPSVADNGPFNPHFVRDIGCAYLVAGGGLIWFSIDRRARPAALAGGVFLALHALVHLGDAMAGHEGFVHFLEDIPTVILPGLLVFIIARGRFRFSKENDDAEMADAAADHRLRTGL